MVWSLEMTSRTKPFSISAGVRLVSMTTVMPPSLSATKPLFWAGEIRQSSLASSTSVPSMSNFTVSPRSKASTKSLPSTSFRYAPILPSSLP